MASRDSFFKKLEVRNGALRVQRYAVGMAPVRNAHSATPTNKGWWVFPWPLINWYQCVGKIEPVMPRHLMRGGWFDEPTQREATPSYDPNVDGDWERWSDARERWRREVGRRVVRVHDGWWAGPIYSRISPTAEGLRGDWFLYPDAAAWLKVARRCARKLGDDPPYADDYELWLPSGPGHNRL